MAAATSDPGGKLRPPDSSRLEELLGDYLDTRSRSRSWRPAALMEIEFANEDLERIYRVMSQGPAPS